MNNFRLTFKLLSLVLFVAAAASTAQAQATRTWVSGVGDDVNPCSRTAPCKTYAGAISKTAASGEISTLDPGGFGAVTTTKSITIDGTQGQGYGSILASSTNGVIINDSLSATPNTAVVVLRNLSINGAPTTSPGSNGIRFIAGKSLHVENCQITGFLNNSAGDFGNGILVNVSAGSAHNIVVKDTIVRNSAKAGIRVNSSVAGAANAVKLTIINSSFDQNLSEGVRIENNVRASVFNSSASTNGQNGFVVGPTTLASDLNVDNCVAANNGQFGVAATGAVGQTGTLRLFRTTITNNATSGVQILANGSVLSAGNNNIHGNGPGGVTNVSGGVMGSAPQS